MTNEEAIQECVKIQAFGVSERQVEAMEMAIKALEQEPCGNAIDRAEAIKVASGYCHHANVAKELAKLPPVNPTKTDWIPVSERLPEDSGEYLVTVIDEDVETYKHTGIAWYAHPKDYDVEEGDWRELMIDEKVIAWMPLPKTYEPQESEDKCKNCEYYRNPDYTRCHECKAESEDKE